jgi:hypothetical protein
MNPVSLIAGFAPLVLLGLLDGPLPVADAAVIAAALALLITAFTIRRGPALGIVQIVTLAAIAAIAFTGSTDTRHWLATYGGGLSSLVLAAYMLATLPFAPFTAAFARAGVPRELWNSSRFLDTNRRISAVWGIAVLILGLSRLAVAALHTHSPLLQWGPAVLAIIYAVRYTRRTVAQAHDSTPSDSQQATSYR